MKKIQKVIIIISVLLAPIFVFLFLKEFGTNKFELPVYYPEGNPITACKDYAPGHQVNAEIIREHNVTLPALVYAPSLEQNEYYSDLDNVLQKFPEVNLLSISMAGSTVAGEVIQSLSFDSLAYMNFINCELILGEDQLLKQAVVNKYVLLDSAGNIRGYYDCTDLEEIERLDVELDILVNY